MVRARNPSGRGGPRQPTPGAQYTNRSDLQQAPAAPTGQPYGQAGAQIAAQRAIPLPGGGGLPPAAGPPANVPMPGPQGQPQIGAPGAPQPGSFGPLNAPSQRPGEALTHGSPSGPGAGPEVLPPGATGDNLVNQIRALYQMFPTEEIRYMLAKATGGPR